MMLLLINSPARTLVVIDLGRGGGVTECICILCFSEKQFANWGRSMQFLFCFLFYNCVV